MSALQTISILDAARIFGELEVAQSLQKNFLNLHMGKDGDYLSSVAPYLFAYQPGLEFGKWLLEKGWGNSWGVFIKTEVSLEEVQLHLRKYLMIKTDTGKEMYFRFYDPRVLRKYLPTCDPNQLKEFFGPIKSFGMESENPEFALEFSLDAGKLITTSLSKLDFLNRLNSPDAHDTSTARNSEQPESKNKNDDAPGKKWSFLIE